MKFFHIADLHLGKKLLKESMYEEQLYVLNEIIEYVRQEEPDGILIAGDIYDKAIPSADAVGLLDDFLAKLQELDTPVYLISGNHDSGERLFFGKRIFEKRNIHIGSVYRGTLDSVILRDEFGPLQIHMLPFIKPAMVQPFFEKEIETYEEAVRQVILNEQIDTSARNILLAHQFVTHRGEKPARSESEQISIGGLDEVDTSVFKKFDYVALGHIHRPQSIGEPTIRYAGSPLKYSFSEVQHHKAISCVELRRKGDVRVTKLPLYPRKDLVKLEDALENLLSEEYREYRQGYYLSITVTDEEKLMDPIGQLRTKFEGILEFQIQRTRNLLERDMKVSSEELVKKTPMHLFEDFFLKQNDMEMNNTEKHIMKKLFQK